MASSQYDYLFKVLILGDSAVGKTCLLLKYSEDKFSSTHMPTIGIDFKAKMVNVQDQKIQMQLWDTAGQERYKTITNTLYNNVVGIVLCYSVDNRNSFNNIEHWMKQIQNHVGNEVAIVLVGNKSDVETKSVTSEEGRYLAQTYEIEFFETSAKSGDNIQQTFSTLTSKILANVKQNPNAISGKQKSGNITVLNTGGSNDSKQKEGGCC